MTYQLEEGESLDGDNEIYVVYGDNYTLAIPKNSDYNKIFIGWENVATHEEFVSNGKWNIAGDVVLKAKWVDAANPGDWTGNH